MNYDELLEQWFNKLMDESEKSMAISDEQSEYTYRKGYNKGFSEGLLLFSISTLSNLEKKHKRNESEVKQFTEEQLGIVEEGLLLTLDRYKNIIKIDNVTKELKFEAKLEITRKISDTIKLLEYVGNLK